MPIAMMNWDRAALLLVVVNVVASTAHCLDNIWFFECYPEPSWIDGPRDVDALYLVAMGLLALGYAAYRRRERLRASVCLLLFCLISASALGHYLYAPLSALSLKMNVLIVAETSAALVLATFVVVLQLRWPHKRPADTQR